MLCIITYKICIICLLLIKRCTAFIIIKLKLNNIICKVVKFHTSFSRIVDLSTNKNVLQVNWLDLST